AAAIALVHKKPNRHLHFSRLSTDFLQVLWCYRIGVPVWNLNALILPTIALSDDPQSLSVQ
ncbi:MAG: hypothetical protein JAY73_14035, partial [Candidatus Thiodiazotropha taylori]|nr:hypothetical protein [Candidatus Thiodiazotropha taylori]